MYRVCYAKCLKISLTLTRRDYYIGYIVIKFEKYLKICMCVEIVFHSENKNI